MSIATVDRINQDVSAEVRAMMARKRITGKSLAARLGMTEMALSRRINGSVDFSVGELVAVAVELGCDVADLLPHLDSNQEHFDYQSQQEDDYPFRGAYELAA